MQNRRVVVTGGFGFIGSQLCRILVEGGFDVAVVDDLSVGRPENLAPDVAEETQTLVADVRDLQTMEAQLSEFAPVHVFHLAAVHFIPSCERHPTHAVAVNVVGTQAVLEACSRLDSLESVVIASSGAVYAPDDYPHSEEAALGPTDVYGSTKAWNEWQAQYFNRQTDIPVGIARIFNAVGPGETNPHLLPAIIEQILAGHELRLGDLTTRRDYVFSADVARGIALLAEGCKASGVLTCNLGSENPVSGNHLVAVVARLAGREVEVTADPARLRASDRPVLASDSRRAHETLGWRAETSLESAVEAALMQPFAVGFVGSPLGR
jgi:UDP-glucose 4-epimerase